MQPVLSIKISIFVQEICLEIRAKLMWPYSRPYHQILCRPYSIKCTVLCIKCSPYLRWLPRFSCQQEITSSAVWKSNPPSASRPPLSQLFSSPENEKWSALLPPSCFLFTLSEFLNPMVEKESNQRMRLNESENHFYLFLINKITHPLKFIKKWLYSHKVSLSDN